ncbi:kinase-like domain-containing protein, partial [Jimgerdemannia flammicorona]
LANKPSLGTHQGEFRVIPQDPARKPWGRHHQVVHAHPAERAAEGEEVVAVCEFENATEYYVEGENLTHFINALVHTEHFLVFTDTFEHDGVYIIASPTLYDRDDRDDVIQMLIRTCFPQDENNMITSETGEDYLLILSPWQSFMWTGEVVNLHLKKILVDMKPNRVRLVIENANQLPLAKEQFWKSVMGSGIEMVQEARAHIPRVNRELSKIRRTVFKLAELTINSVNMLRGFVGGVQCQDLIEESFSFGSDFGNRAAKFLEPATRAQLELKLVRLAIDWVSFICDDCVPTDRKTFRWAVIALEFAMVMTRGKNILALSEPEFAKLQSKVASCIALLISHFDVLGARSTHEAMKAERERQEVASMDDAEKQLNITMCSTFGTENSLMYVRDEWVRQLNELELRRNAKEQELRLVGKVLDDQRPEDRSLVFLAPSSSSMSFRWQQGKFIGAGTFGSVYLAINLDTSEVMAVKEIRFQDSSSLSALHKSIKEEMKVMQMLHHPNIVRYYGIEVHRDKVYIFMEYCENGSLGSLLEHGGRIEEEVWIANYAYQMLQGLEYLHDNNVVHRDIKPDNILLDGDGTVKFVDFGAAKILAKGQKTMGRTTMNMNVNSLTGTPMYMAPEVFGCLLIYHTWPTVITGGDKGRKGSMDIWSLGCCVVEMATGRRPWANLDNEWAVMYHVVMGHPPLPDASQLSEAGLDFLKKCFTRSPMKRPSARELLGHPWIHAYLESMTPNGEDYTSAMMPGGSAQGGGGPGSQHGSENGSIHSTHSIMTRSSLGSLGVLGGSIGINFVPGEGHAGSLPIGARSIASSPGRSLPMPLPRPPMPPREMSMSSRSIRSEGSSRPGSPV